MTGRLKTEALRVTRLFTSFLETTLSSSLSLLHSELELACVPTNPLIHSVEPSVARERTRPKSTNTRSKSLLRTHQVSKDPVRPQPFITISGYARGRRDSGLGHSASSGQNKARIACGFKLSRTESILSSFFAYDHSYFLVLVWYWSISASRASGSLLRVWQFMYFWRNAVGKLRD